jgi:CheY-like chemotaxis protein
VKANEKDLRLEYKSETSTPQSIVSDPLRVRQILLNLVGNAIKFTQFGSVKIRSFGTTDQSSKTTLYFEVTDTGIGISEDQREKIFEMFVQADGTSVRRFGGTGLGLALSRRLARNLGGDVAVVRSTEGNGSTFLMTVPDQPHQLSSSLPSHPIQSLFGNAESGALEGVKVLVVDDSLDNQQLIWSFLNRYGATVETAENGFIGYKKAISGNHNIVLMDIQMPEMDGYTATQKLREAGYNKPIIALTALAMNEVHKKCMNVGCTDQLTKPIRVQDLVGTIAKYSQH